MSLTNKRQEIADAISEVEGFNGFVVKPTTVKAGAAWALLESLNASGALGVFTKTWRVQIVTGGTPSDAISFLDSEVRDDLIDALATVGWVLDIRPVGFDDGQEGIELRLTTD